MMNEIRRPYVSVCMITYNHEQYIEQAINGVLMQQCSFDVELIISNDCSPDHTDQIIKKIVNTHPCAHWIKYTKHLVNKGITANFIWTLKQARGKYIAICEGDDYWIDSLKLQKQVAFMEQNQDCALCFHASKSINNNNPNEYIVSKPKDIPMNNKFEIKHVILKGGTFMATNSMFFLKEHINYIPEWLSKVPVGDLPLMLLLGSKGKIGFIDEVMSVYRIMSSSTSWSAKMRNPKNKKKHFYGIMTMWSDFDKWTNREYHKYVVIKKKIDIKSYYKGKLKYFIKKMMQ